MIQALAAALILAVGAGATASAAQLPPAAEELVAEFTEFEREVMQKAAAEVATGRQKLIADLETLKQELGAAGEQEAAKAVTGEIRLLLAMEALRGAEIRQNPQELATLKNLAPDTVLYFKVKGDPSAGPVWGSRLYTLDSALAAAAVHSGLVKPGQTEVVKVTIKPGQQEYSSSSRAGVKTRSRGPFELSYRVQRAVPKEPK
jgi:hypothetical protein